MNSIIRVNQPLAESVKKEIHDAMGACVIRLSERNFNESLENKKNLIIKKFILTLSASQMLKNCSI